MARIVYPVLSFLFGLAQLQIITGSLINGKIWYLSLMSMITIKMFYSRQAENRPEVFALGRLGQYSADESRHAEPVHRDEEEQPQHINETDHTT